MQIKVHVYFLVFLSFNSFFAQNEEEKLRLSNNFKHNVKNIDDFIDRFNNVKKISLRDSFNDTTHSSILVSLFDLQDQNLIQNKDSKDFVKFISSKKVYKLNYYDSLWYAIARCQYEYKGKDVVIDIYLKIEMDANGGVKWVIQDFKSDFLKSPFKNDSDYINPVDNDLNFVKLGSLLSKGAISRSLIVKDAKYNNYNLYSYLVSEKLLKFKHVINTSYWFMQIPEWGFVLSYKERNDKNSGLLITYVKKMSNEEKHNFFNILF
jgi:hypothetical protein